MILHIGSAVKSLSSSTSASNEYFPDFDSKITIKEPSNMDSPTPLLTGEKIQGAARDVTINLQTCF